MIGAHKNQAAHAVITPRTRAMMAFDSLMLVLPFLAYLTNDYWVCLAVLNIAVPLVHSYALFTGIEAFHHWQGRWKDLETAWLLALSTTTCFMFLCLIANWYIKSGWNIIGIYENMLWSYMHYCSARTIVAFHRYVRKHG